MSVYDLKGKRVDPVLYSFYYSRSGTTVDIKLSDDGLGAEDFVFLRKILHELENKYVNEILTGIW